MKNLPPPAQPATAAPAHVTVYRGAKAPAPMRVDGAALDPDALPPATLAWRAPTAAHDGPSTPADRARALAAALPPSVEGHGGDAALFHAANELATVLGENAAAIATVLADVFNPRCVPPWDAHKLRREAERAATRQATPEARHGRRLATRDAYHVPEAPSAALMMLDTTRQGTPRPTHANVLRVLEHVFGERIRYEEHAGRITCANVDESLGHFPAGDWTDAHTTAALVVCEGLGLYVAAAAVDRAVAVHARQRAHNVLSDFLARCAAQWDGVARVDAALTRYWGAVNDAATRAVARVFLLSLAARGLDPGCKVDTCPVFVGAQGTFKSSSFRALVGAPWFCDSSLPIGDKDGMQNLRGTWLWEFPERDSITRRERNQVKAFLSSSADKFRASYGRHAETVPRQTCFVASTNDQEVLTDPTGARRFLPVTVGGVDLAAIERDRVQLLGEAARRVGDGEQHWPMASEERALNLVRVEHEELDPWEDPIREWLGNRKGKPFTIADVFSPFGGAVPMPEAHVDKRAQGRAAAVLRRLGFQRKRSFERATRNRWFWLPGSHLAPT